MEQVTIVRSLKKVAAFWQKDMEVDWIPVQEARMSKEREAENYGNI